MVVGNSLGNCGWLVIKVAKEEERQGQIKETRAMKKKKFQLCQ